MNGLPRRANPPGWLLLVLVAGCYWRFGYTYGIGDHEELLPQLFRALDPSLFPRDAYLLAESEHFSVRIVFISLLRGLSLLMPPPAAVFVLTIVAWVGVSWAAYRLSFTLVPHRVVAPLAVLATLATALWTPGGNALVFTMLVPESLAWIPCLLAVEAFARERHYQSALLLGLGAWLHPLMGLQIGLLLGLVVLWRLLDGAPRHALRDAFGFGVLFFVVASPLIAPSLLTQTHGAPIPNDGLSTYYITAQLRQPHHYLLFSQSPIRLGLFALLCTSGGVGLWILNHKQESVPAERTRFACRTLAVIAALLLFYVAMTEGAESALVAKMQFFRLLVLAKLFLLVWACGALVALTPSAWVTWIERVMHRPSIGWAGALGLAGLTVMLAALDVGRPGAMWRPRAHAQTDPYRVTQWARTHTPKDALFLVPPSTDWFRSYAFRSVVFNHKPTPFRDAAMHERLARLRTVAPPPSPTGQTAVGL